MSPCPSRAAGASKLPMDASRDGRYLFTVTVAPGPVTNDATRNRLWVLPLFGDRKPFPYPQTEFQEHQPRLSPDGRWLAYKSNESKRDEIYRGQLPAARREMADLHRWGQGPSVEPRRAGTVLLRRRQ
jgi:hypothetical protein